MTPIAIGRRTFIVCAAAALMAACSGDDDSPATAPATTRPPPPSGLALKGVNFDTDRDIWEPEFVRREIEAIQRDLHCNAIFLLGSELERLVLSASIAAEVGLYVWFEPRHFDSDAAETIEFVSTVARAAEELRSEHPDVGLSSGVELTIFLDGILPGNDWLERGEALAVAQPAEYNAALNQFLGEALVAIRPLFGGQLTYSSGEWEEVDWSGFDVVGIDLYRDANNAATYVDHVRSLHRHGKPVVITEFGCCTVRGAEDLGGSGFMAVDWFTEPVVIPDDLVRDEQVQARYIDELLDIFQAENLYGAFIYDFIEPGNPYSPDPAQDFDMVGFAVVKCYPSGHELAYDRTGHFKPKAAFHTIARRFR
jgi:hypothetical protein